MFSMHRLPSRTMVRKILGFYCLVMYIPLVVSLSAQTRKSTLLSWSNENTIGWVQERRDTEAGTFHVTIGYGDEETLTVKIPYVAKEESLASTLWPCSSVGALLSRSPFFPKQKSILELGSGIGLAGWTAALNAKSCHLTDNDELIIKMHQDMISEENSSSSSSSNSSSNVQASCLDWRDSHENAEKVDIIMGTDIAYYYYLLRPLMDTVQTFMKERKSMVLIIGQANRESQWELYHNIVDGCYNQLTDEHEQPWEGTTKMLLYKLQMETWQDEDDNTSPASIDGTIPVSAILYQTPGSDVASLSPYDYVASAKDEEKMMMTF